MQLKGRLFLSAIVSHETVFLARELFNFSPEKWGFFYAQYNM